MKTVTIPSNYNPWICEINGVRYSYTAGTSQSVPDEVAELIEIINAAEPHTAPVPGSAGDVWTMDANGIGHWESIPTATKESAGVMKMASKTTDVTGTYPTKAEFNAFLATLRSAGIIATS